MTMLGNVLFEKAPHPQSGKPMFWVRNRLTGAVVGRITWEFSGHFYTCQLSDVMRWGTEDIAVVAEFLIFLPAESREQ